MAQMPTSNSSSRIDAFLGTSFRLIAILFLGRFAIDIGTRVVFPFIPQISAGLGVTTVVFSLLISIRTLAGVASPLLGLLSDRLGRRKIMMVGLFCQAAGVLGLALLPWPAPILAMALYGLALAAYIPAQQAYISDQVAYQRRGRALAVVELSWASAAIFILPLLGWLIDNFDWRAPFMLIGLYSLIAATILWLRLPVTETRSQTRLTWLEFRAIFFRGNVLAAVGVALLVFLGVGAFVTLWGLWLTADFQLGAAGLGLVATGIGIAEGVGSGTSSLIIDRLGKRLGSGLALVMTALLLSILPFTQNNLMLAIATLIAIGLFIEFAIVSLIPIYSEQVPEARATVLALVLVGIAIGGTVGTPLAAALWEWRGLGAVCAMTAGALVLAFGMLWKFLDDS